MADAKHLLEFLERGRRMLVDMGLQFLGVEFAPVPTTLLGSKRALLGGLQIAIDRAAGQAEAAGGLGLGTPFPDELDDPFPQIQRVSFHARKPILLCPNVNMKCYNCSTCFSNS